MNTNVMKFPKQKKDTPDEGGHSVYHECGIPGAVSYRFSVFIDMEELGDTRLVCSGCGYSVTLKEIIEGDLLEDYE
jgi:hypothetical protein